MGVWGAGLYHSDIAAEVRELLGDLVRLPYDADKLVSLIGQAFPEPSKPDDESYNDFCLALADQFHLYGIQNENALKRALDLIASGADLERRRALGASERELRQRARVLADLSKRLQTSHPRPRKRNVLAKPENWLFEEGECVAYPTRRGEPINPYFPHRLLADWSQDSWAAFVVLGRSRLLDYFAIYLIAVYEPAHSALPRLEQLAAGVPIPFNAALVSARRRDLSKMRLEPMGRTNLRVDLIEQEFSPGAPPFDCRPVELANALCLHPGAYNHGTRPDLRRFIGGSEPRAVTIV